MGLLDVTVIFFVIAMFAGLLGSLLGLGGGVVVVPALTLVFGVPIRLAIGASIVAIIATSVGSSATYVKTGLANIKIGLFLELGTTLGAITGAYVAGLVDQRVLFVVFGLVLAYSAIHMFSGKKGGSLAFLRQDKLADRLCMHGTYFEESKGETITYQVQRTRLGLLLMYAAGLVSGLLGVGSGSLKVPAMDLAMGLPMKVSTATSNFMIGVTGAASAGVYFLRGDIDPLIAAPVALGVLLGATIGARALPKIHSSVIRWIFVIVLLGIAVQMLFKGVF